MGEEKKSTWRGEKGWVHVASQLPIRYQRRRITHRCRVSARADAYTRTMTGEAHLSLSLSLSPAGSTWLFLPCILSHSRVKRIRSPGYLLSLHIIQPFVAAGCGSSLLVASFTSRPCSHARTHIHTDEALPPSPPPPPPPPPRNSSRTLVVLVPRRIHTPIERATAKSRSATRWLHYYSDFFFRRFLARRYLTPSRSDWLPSAPLLPLTAVSISFSRTRPSFGPTPSVLARVCVAHRSSDASVTPGKHRNIQILRRPARRGRNATVRNDETLRKDLVSIFSPRLFRDLKFVRLGRPLRMSRRTRTNVHKQTTPASPKPRRSTHLRRAVYHTFFYLSFSLSISVCTALSTCCVRSLDLTLESPGLRYLSLSLPVSPYPPLYHSRSVALRRTDTATNPSPPPPTSFPPTRTHTRKTMPKCIRPNSRANATSCSFLPVVSRRWRCREKHDTYTLTHTHTHTHTHTRARARGARTHFSSFRRLVRSVVLLSRAARVGHTRCGFRLDVVRAQRWSGRPRLRLSRWHC